MDHPDDDLLRQYYLTSDDRGAAGDIRYVLVFTKGGEMVVRMTRSHEQQYKSPEVQDIPPRDFQRISIAGKSLLQWVLQKLVEILPSSD